MLSCLGHATYIYIWQTHTACVRMSVCARIDIHTYVHAYWTLLSLLYIQWYTTKISGVREFFYAWMQTHTIYCTLPMQYNSGQIGFVSQWLHFFVPAIVSL